MMRVADTVARGLAAAGVRHAFGMPGGEVVTLVDALADAGIRFVLARHETAAAIMAAGAAAATGAPGLLVTTLGPSLANAVNGISPRLSVFRKAAGRWLIIAHANFAPIAA
jgi:acetolactate synthase I/II/III large subunit